MKQYDIEYSKLANGAIRLKQNAYGSDDTIDLHPLQLRAIAEHFGLVAPMPPADELAKRLAEQLCAAYLTLLDEQRYWSPRLESLWERLDAQVDCLPGEIFPHHLWENRQETEGDAKAVEKTRSAVCLQSLGCDDVVCRSADLSDNEAGAIDGRDIAFGI